MQSQYLVFWYVAIECLNILFLSSNAVAEQHGPIFGIQKHNDIFNLLPDLERKKLKRSYPKIPDTPMLACVGTVSPQARPCDQWLYERKFDGQRCLCFKRDSTIKLFSRNKKYLNDSYPEIVRAVKKQTAEEFIIDGEIVAFDGDQTSFSKLQERMFRKGKSKVLKNNVPVKFCVFDIIHLNGFDTTCIPIELRKQLLENVIDFKDPLRYVDYKKTDEAAYFRQACKAGWEGLVAKRASSTYQCERSRDWLKLKCVHAQEFVIGGYTNPRGKRADLGALLVGYYDDHKLIYAGKVGTGYTATTLSILAKHLEKLKRKRCPFADFHESSKSVHWVKPCLVAQVKFSEWTKDGKLRHPRFSGIRFDKKADDIVRETGNVSVKRTKTNRMITIDSHAIKLCS